MQEERQLLGNIRKRKRNWLEHIMRRKENIIKAALEGLVEGKRGIGRSRIHLLNEIKKENYQKTKELAIDRRAWKNLTTF